MRNDNVRHMAKKIVVAKKRVVKKPALRVIIDYPQVHEIVRPGHYSIRLTAAGQAQVRVDGGEWLECRDTHGHFWCDWAPLPGRSLLEARARTGKGRGTAAESREVIVKPNEAIFVG